MSKQTKADILRRIQAMTALAQDPNATAGEKLNALGLLRTLQQKYEITDEDIAKAEEPEIVHVRIGLPRATKLAWISQLAVSIGAFYDVRCVMLNSKEGGETHGYLLVGTPVDVKIAETVIDMLLPQALEQSELLYKQGIELHKTRNKGFTKSTSRVITTATTSSVSSINWLTTLFITYESLDFEYELWSLLRGYEDMPDQESEAWRHIEDDWGFGLSASVMHKMEDMARTTAKAEWADTENALIRTSTALALNRKEISARKEQNALDYLRKHTREPMGSRVFERARNNTLFQEGVRVGSERVDIDAKVVKKEGSQ